MNLTVMLHFNDDFPNYGDVSAYNMEYGTKSKIKQDDILDISVIGFPDIIKNNQLIPVMRCRVLCIIIVLKPHCNQYVYNNPKTLFKQKKKRLFVFRLSTIVVNESIIRLFILNRKCTSQKLSKRVSKKKKRKTNLENTFFCLLLIFSCKEHIVYSAN